MDKEGSAWNVVVIHAKVVEAASILCVVVPAIELPVLEIVVKIVGYKLRKCRHPIELGTKNALLPLCVVVWTIPDASAIGLRLKVTMSTVSFFDLP